MSDESWILLILVVAGLAGTAFGILIPDTWIALKDFIRCMARLLMLDSLFKKDAPAQPVPEPDWAAAAEEVGFFDPIPEPLWDDLTLWTSAEREAFDIDATAQFIDSTDSLLSEIDRATVEQANKIAWAEFNQKVEVSAAQVREWKRQRDQSNGRGMKRFGANLLPDTDDDAAALRQLNRERPSRERKRKERLS